MEISTASVGPRQAAICETYASAVGGYSGPGMYGRRHTSIPQSFMAVETVLLVLFDVIGGDAAMEAVVVMGDGRGGEANILGIKI